MDLSNAFAKFRGPATPPVPASKGSAALYTEQATYRFIQWLYSLPDPDVVLQKAGIPRHQLRLMEGDDEISQCLETRRDAVLSVPWHLEPTGSMAAKFIADEIRPVWGDLVRWIFDALPYGYSVVELVYRQMEGGRTGLATKANPSIVGGNVNITLGKPMEWFKPTSRGGLRYFPEDGSGGFLGIETEPIKYLLTVRAGSYRNPYGEALLSRLYWPVFFRRNGWANWARFLERFGTPILLGKVVDPATFVDAMRKAGIDTAIGVQANEDVSAIFPGGTNEFEVMDRTVVARIQKAILGQTLTSEVGKVGSYAAAKVHDNVREDKRNSDIALVTDAAQQLVERLCVLNGFDVPAFDLADDTGLESDRADRDDKLGPVLALSRLSLSRSYFTNRYDLDDDDLDDAPDPSVAALPPANAPNKANIPNIPNIPNMPTPAQRKTRVDELARSLYALKLAGRTGHGRQ